MREQEDQGTGTVVRLSMGLAVREECEAYFACISGIYSQEIYRDLGFTVLREMGY